MFSAVFSCFPTVFRRCFPTVGILFKLNLIIYEGSSVVLRMISDDFRCFPMFSAVYDVFSWVLTFIESLLVQCITTPCAHILWSSLYEVWQDQDALVGYQIRPRREYWRLLGNHE